MARQVVTVQVSITLCSATTLISKIGASAVSAFLGTSEHFRGAPTAETATFSPSTKLQAPVPGGTPCYV